MKEAQAGEKCALFRPLVLSFVEEVVNFVAHDGAFSLLFARESAQSAWYREKTLAETPLPRRRTKTQRVRISSTRMTEKQSDMENKNPSPHFTPPADFFGREMERSRELSPRIEHVESYIDACLGRWKALYPSPKEVNDEARQVGTDVLKTALHKMSEIAERAQKTFLEKGKSPDACREYYVEVSELIDVARDLADWEKTDLRSEIVLLHIDKWKAMRREAYTALEVQGEDLDLDAFYADDEERLPPTWRDSLCYSMPLLLFGALLFFFGRFAGAKVPAGATDVWAQWVGLRPTMGIWVVVPAVLLFSCALFFLFYGVKQLFQGPKPSLLDILKLWAPLLIVYFGYGVEKMLCIDNGFFDPVLPSSFDPAMTVVTWSMIFHTVCSLIIFGVMPLVGTIALFTYVWKTMQAHRRAKLEEKQSA